MKINFINKIAINAVEGDERNWLTADNINEIKNAVNLNEETLTNLQTTVSTNDTNYQNLYVTQTEFNTQINTVNSTVSNLNTQVTNLQNQNQTFPFVFGRENEEFIWGFARDADPQDRTTVGWSIGEIELSNTKIITNQTTFNDNELVTKKYVDNYVGGGGTANWGNNFLRNEIATAVTTETIGNNYQGIFKIGPNSNILNVGESVNELNLGASATKTVVAGDDIELGNRSWTSSDNKGKIIHGNLEINFESLIRTVITIEAKKIIFTPSTSLTTDIDRHKVGAWKDIPDLTINTGYKYIAASKTGTKHEIETLTTTIVTISNIAGGSSYTGYSYQYQIRKNPNNNNIQFRFDYYNSGSGGITIPTTITLYLFIT